MATISGEWSGTIGTNNTTVDSWTVISDGEHTITWSVESARSYGHFAIIETSNGVTEGPQESLNVASVVTVTESLNAGDVVNFQARINVVGSSGSGSWEVTPPPPLPSNAVTPDQIGGVYVGDELADALYHGSILLWRRIVTVTPLPPTFLDAAPWLELPTVEGVSYSVDGTAGPGNTVTVTAVADDGYELDGQTTWAHTYPSPYSESGTFGARNLDRLTWENVATHTLTADIANATITLDVTLDVLIVYAEWRLRVLVNGQQVAIGPPTKAFGDPPPPLSTVADGADGDLVQFQVQGPDSRSDRLVGSGSWSIVEN